jgi:glycosyltransferase involved in cell wall biosynthesis
MIRLVIDSQSVTPRRSGIGEETRQITQALLRKFSEVVEVHLYNGSSILPVRSVEEANEIWRMMGKSRSYDLIHQFRLPLLLTKRKFDVFLSPEPIVPFLNFRVPMIAIINDVISFAIPEYFRNSKRARLAPVFRLMHHLCIACCKRIIVISNHSKKDVMSVFSCPEAKIDVTYLGGPDKYSVAPAEPGLDVKPRQYFLYVGRRNLYKGIDLLIRAFGAMKSGTQSATKLVFAGEPDAQHEEYYASLIAESGCAEDIITAGYVNDSQLAWLYQNALALVHPSLYEGFGLPPLYAMAYGVPVVCSDRASLPEVVGDAALLTDPENTGQFAEALRRISTDERLRESLIQKGTEQSRKFDWDSTADNILASIRKAVENG